MHCQRARICAEDANHRRWVDPADVGQELWVIVNRPEWGAVMDFEGDIIEEMTYQTPYYVEAEERGLAVFAGTVELLARGPDDFREITELLLPEPWMMKQKGI